VRHIVLCTALALAGCASASALHEGKTALEPQEGAVMSRTADRSGISFRKVWKVPGLKPWAMLKWDQDHSAAAPGAPPGLLQAIRDEVGRLNQQPAKGEDFFLTVTVYSYDRGGWFSEPSAAIELVARDGKGRAAWVADDQVTVRPELAQTLADSEEMVLAREITRKVRQEFGR
jgi:hypothetical protein